jgi:hypothetical protein
MAMTEFGSSLADTTAAKTTKSQKSSGQTHPQRLQMAIAHK